MQKRSLALPKFCGRKKLKNREFTRFRRLFAKKYSNFLKNHLLKSLPNFKLFLKEIAGKHYVCYQKTEFI